MLAEFLEATAAKNTSKKKKRLRQGILATKIKMVSLILIGKGQVIRDLFTTDFAFFKAYKAGKTV